MKFSSMRNAIVIASVIVGSVIPSQAFAQTDFFAQFGSAGTYNGSWTAEYLFKQPMVLNSIGFYTQGKVMKATSYSIGSGSLISVTPGAVDSNGFQWYEFSGGVTVNTGTTLFVHTNSYANTDTNPIQTPFLPTAGPYNFASNVIEYKGATPSGQGINQGWTNSNIRVSNPGSNVAPEPGSFALALTGGAALIGVCIRRRRNAA
jgi:hypothetical protein